MESVSGAEISVTAEVSVGDGLFPIKGRLALTMTKRFGDRGAEVIEPSRAAIGEDRLEELLAGNEELDVLAVQAITAAAESASVAKRRLLARVVKAAVLDDAKIDESALIVGVLRQIDAPHIRCLEAIYRAEQEAKASGDLQPTARGAEKELTQQVRAVADSYPPPLLTQLEHLGLIDGSITWGGVTLITGTTVFGAQVLEDLHSISE